MSRSGDGSEPRVIMLEREPEELTIQLPAAAKPDDMKPQLTKKEQTVVSAAANAEIQKRHYCIDFQ